MKVVLGENFPDSNVPHMQSMIIFHSQMTSCDTCKEFRGETRRKFLHECDKVNFCKSADVKLGNGVSLLFEIIEEEKSARTHRCIISKLLITEANKIDGLFSSLFESIKRGDKPSISFDVVPRDIPGHTFDPLLKRSLFRCVERVSNEINMITIKAIVRALEFDAVWHDISNLLEMLLDGVILSVV
jgi:hypothetical protein